MKNPLDSITGTIIAGFVLLVVLVAVIAALFGAGDPLDNRTGAVIAGVVILVALVAQLAVAFRAMR